MGELYRSEVTRYWSVTWGHEREIKYGVVSTIVERDK